MSKEEVVIDRAQVVEMLEAGKTRAEIGEALGLNASATKRAFKDMGLSKRKPRGGQKYTIVDSSAEVPTAKDEVAEESVSNHFTFED